MAAASAAAQRCSNPGMPESKVEAAAPAVFAAADVVAVVDDSATGAATVAAAGALDRDSCIWS